MPNGSSLPIAPASSADITISSGKVDAIAGDGNSAGIGAAGGASAEVTVKGGRITAKPGNESVQAIGNGTSENMGPDNGYHIQNGYFAEPCPEDMVENEAWDMIYGVKLDTQHYAAYATTDSYEDEYPTSVYFVGKTEISFGEGWEDPAFTNKPIELDADKLHAQIVRTKPEKGPSQGDPDQPSVESLTLSWRKADTQDEWTPVSEATPVAGGAYEVRASLPAVATGISYYPASEAIKTIHITAVDGRCLFQIPDFRGWDPDVVDYTYGDTLRGEASVCLQAVNEGTRDTSISPEDDELVAPKPGEGALYYRPAGAPADGSADVQLTQPKDMTDYRYWSSRSFAYDTNKGKIPIGNQINFLFKYFGNDSVNSLEESKTITLRPQAPKLLGEECSGTQIAVETIEGQEYAFAEGNGDLPADAEWKSYSGPIVIDNLKPGTKYRVWTRVPDQSLAPGSDPQWVVSKPLDAATWQYQVEATDGGSLVYGDDFTYENGVLTLKSDTPITISNQPGVETVTDSRISVETPQGVTANLTLDDVNASNDDIVLQEGASLDLTLPKDSANTFGRIKEGQGAKLTINGEGSLKVSWGVTVTQAEIVINGGTIVSTAYLCEGIGGQDAVITINGGNVTASGYEGRASIGGPGSSVTITGGTVNATAGSGAAGIGSNRSTTSKSLVITGGKITATSPNGRHPLGGDDSGSVERISVTGGEFGYTHYSPSRETWNVVYEVGIDDGFVGAANNNPDVQEREKYPTKVYKVGTSALAFDEGNLDCGYTGEPVTLPTASGTWNGKAVSSDKITVQWRAEGEGDDAWKPASGEGASSPVDFGTYEIRAQLASGFDGDFYYPSATSDIRTVNIVKSTTSIEPITWNGDTQTGEFAYGDTITVKANIKATGLPASSGNVLDSIAAFARGLLASELAEPQTGEAVLYYRPAGASGDGQDVQLTDPQNVADANGELEFSYNTKDGVLPISDNITLVVKYVGTDKMDSQEQTCPIKLAKGVYEGESPSTPELDPAQCSGAQLAVKAQADSGLEYTVTSEDKAPATDAVWTSATGAEKGVLVLNSLSDGKTPLSLDTQYYIWTRVVATEVVDASAPCDKPLIASTWGFAVEKEGGDPEYGADYTYENGVLTVKTDTPLTIKNQEGLDQTDDSIVVSVASSAKSAHITLAGVNSVATTADRAPLSVIPGSSLDLVLADTSTNEFKGSYNQNSNIGPIVGRAGVNVPAGAHLTISGSGVLKATAGGNKAAGIGGDYIDEDLSNSDSGSISIEGGTITSEADMFGAGIGSALNGNADEISIAHGTVNAKGGGAGIGSAGGLQTSTTKINISGDAQVTATCTGSGAGIGGGDYTEMKGISIGDNVAVVAKSTTSGAGIGAGEYGTAQDISISGNATVLVQGGKPDSVGGVGAPGIGGGSGTSEKPYFAGGTGSGAISGGRIAAVAGSAKVSAIGDGLNAPETGRFIITGGVFAEDAPEDADETWNSVYGVALDADSYVAGNNNDSDTETTKAYPTKVYQKGTSWVGFSEGWDTPTYNAQPIALDATTLKASVSRSVATHDNPNSVTDDIVFSWRMANTQDDWTSVSGAGVTTPQNAGSYEVKADISSVFEENTYYPSASTDGVNPSANKTIAINPASLTVAINDPGTIAYGAKAPTFTWEATGWVADEGDKQGTLYESLENALTFTCKGADGSDYAPGSPEGNYTVALGWKGEVQPAELHNYKVELSEPKTLVVDTAEGAIEVSTSKNGTQTDDFTFGDTLELAVKVIPQRTLDTNMLAQDKPEVALSYNGATLTSSSDYTVDDQGAYLYTLRYDTGEGGIPAQQGDKPATLNVSFSGDGNIAPAQKDVDIKLHKAPYTGNDPQKPELKPDRCSGTEIVFSAVPDQEYAVTEDNKIPGDEAEWHSADESAHGTDLIGRVYECEPNKTYYVWTRVKATDTTFASAVLNDALVASTWGLSIESEGDNPVYGTDFTYENGVLNVISDKAVTIKNQEGVQETTDSIAVSTPQDKIANITLGGVGVTRSAGCNCSPLSIASGSNLELILSEGSTNTLYAGNSEWQWNTENRAGINVPYGASLTIKGSGKLHAEGGKYAAGIGSNGAPAQDPGSSESNLNEFAAGSITINGGEVKAVGGNLAAGIGGGALGRADSITLTGGTITAIGGSSAACIAGGFCEHGSGTISGGRIIVLSDSAVVNSDSGSAQVIGNGSSYRGTADQTFVITGGEFGDAKPGESGETWSTVYGVELGEGYLAGENNVTDDKDAYPTKVYTKGQSSVAFADGWEDPTYTGMEIMLPPVTAQWNGNDVPSDKVTLQWRSTNDDSDGNEWAPATGEGASAPKDAGTYEIKADVASAFEGDVYYPAISTDGQNPSANKIITINRAPLSVDLDEADAIEYGDDAPAFTWKAHTFVEGDASEQQNLDQALKDALVVTCKDSTGNDYAAGSPAGAYDVALSWKEGKQPEALHNYDVALGDKKTLTVNGSDDTDMEITTSGAGGEPQSEFSLGDTLEVTAKVLPNTKTQVNALSTETPTATLSYGDTVLAQSDEYTVDPKTGAYLYTLTYNVSDRKVAPTSDGSPVEISVSFSGDANMDRFTQPVSVNLKKTKLESDWFVAPDNLVYDGSAKEVVVDRIKAPEFLTDADWKASYDNHGNMNYGTVTATIHALGAWFEDAEEPFEVLYFITKGGTNISDIDESLLTKVYDGTPFDAPHITVTDDTGKVISNAKVSFRWQSATYEDLPSNEVPTSAGAYKLLVDVEGSENYDACSRSFDITINKAPLTVTAQDIVLAYGDDFPSNPGDPWVSDEWQRPVCKASVEGWVSEDEQKALEGTLLKALVFSSTYTNTSNVGTYPVSVGWGSSGKPDALSNYEVVEFSGATLTVNRVDATKVEVLTQTPELTYGEMLEVKAVVSADHDVMDENASEVSEQDAETLQAKASSEPQYGKATLSYGDAVLCESSQPSRVSAGEYRYTFTYDTARGIVPAGSPQTLTVHFLGDNNIEEGTGTIEVTINKVPAKTVTVGKINNKSYDGKAIAQPEVDLGGYDGNLAFNWYVSNGADGWLKLASAPTKAGVYQLRVTANETATQKAPTIENAVQAFEITKQTQSKPEAIIVVGESFKGGNDGSITGLSQGMEWRAVTPLAGAQEPGYDGTWAPVPASCSLFGLAPGIYEIRWAADENHEASEPVQVTVEQSTKPNPHEISGSSQGGGISGSGNGGSGGVGSSNSGDADKNNNDKNMPSTLTTTGDSLGLFAVLGALLVVLAAVIGVIAYRKTHHHGRYGAHGAHGMHKRR